MTKPFFSIVLPTRNRCKLLPYAIRSVMAQTFGNFELIVSDNFSSDETREVVKGFDDPRIKYFRTGESLSIGSSYQFALSKAAGEYIAFLSDDDAYAPVLLERIKEVIDEHKVRIVAFHFAHYDHDGDFEFNRQIPPNTMVFSAFTGKVTKFAPAAANELLYQRYGLNGHDLNEDFIISFLSNAVYHNSVLSRIQTVRKDLFASTPADMYVTAAQFFVIDAYYCLDMPLYVWSSWSDNITALPHKTGNELRERYEKLLNGQQLLYTPLKFALPQNCTIDAILQAKHDFDKEGKVKISWSAYYIAIYDYLMIIRNAGVNVSAELQEFDEVLSWEPDLVRDQVNKVIHGFRFRSKQYARRSQPLVRLVKRLLRRRRMDRQIFIEGDTNGFDNVLSAANVLAGKVSQRASR